MLDEEGQSPLGDFPSYRLETWYIIVPLIAERMQKRKLFVILGAVLTLPTLVPMAFTTSYSLPLVSGFLFGLFFLSVRPIIYQYSAEICYPAPETTLQGFLVLAIQISGIIYTCRMDAFRSTGGSMTPLLLFMIAVIPINILLATRLKESTMVETGSGR